MKNAKRSLTASLALLLLAGVAFAQSADKQLQTKKALVNRLMKEKFHLSRNVTGETGETRQRTTGYDQRVSASGSGTGEAEVFICHNPNDSSHLVVSYMEQSAAGVLSFPIYYSSNAGASWTRSSFNSLSVLTSDFPGQFPAGGGDPAFAWDKNGKLYFTWIYLSINSSFDTAYFTLNWAYSNDSGRTWGTTAKHFVGRGVIEAASNNILPRYDGITDREWLAVDNSGGPYQGHVYCSFVCFPPGSAPGYEGIKTLIPGIDTFGNAVPAFHGNSQFGNVEVDKNGVLHMSFADIDHSQVRHVASTDGGATFGTSTLVANASVIFPSGPTYVLHNRENAAINMAVDGAGGTGNNVHIVWSDFPGSTSAFSYYSHSTDGGSTWSSPDTLNSRFGNQYTLMPTVAAYGNNVAVSVFATTGTDSTWYYQLSSTDNGATFSPPAITSALPTRFLANGANHDSSPLFFGDYAKSVRTECEVYATWSDGRSNTAKVYFSRKNFCRLGVQEISTVNAGIQLNSVFPNPARGNANLDITADHDGRVTILLSDLGGKKILSQVHSISRGNQRINVNLAGIASGAYVLSLSDSDGSVIATRQLVIR